MERHLDIGVGAGAVELARRLERLAHLGRVHRRAELGRQRLDPRAEFKQLRIAHHSGTAHELQRRTNQRLAAREQHAARKALLDRRPGLEHDRRGRRFPRNHLDDIVDSLRGDRAGRHRRPACLERGLAPLGQQDIGVARAEGALGRAAYAAFLPAVVEQHGGHGERADDGETDL